MLTIFRFLGDGCDVLVEEISQDEGISKKNIDFLFKFLRRYMNASSIWFGMVLREISARFSLFAHPVTRSCSLHRTSPAAVHNWFPYCYETC